jgi:ParB family chromosome partitioning protein
VKKVNLKKTEKTETKPSHDPMLSAPTRLIALEDIASGENARREVGNVADLAASMSQVGLLQPIVVRDSGKTGSGEGWTLVAGARRLAAARALGWKAIRATVLEGIDHGAAALAENVSRVDLSPFEEAQALSKEIASSMGPTQSLEEALEAAAGKLGIPVKRARRRMALNNLETSWWKTYQQGKVTLEALELLASVGAKERKEIHVGGWGMTTRKTVAEVLKRGEHDVASAPFDTKACSECLQRIGVVRDLFDPADGLGKMGTCSKHECWDKRATAAIAEKVERARAKHGDALVVVAESWETSGNKGKAELAKRLGGTSRHDLMSCKVGEKGAVPVVHLFGHEAGKVTWARALTTRGAQAKSTGPKTEKEKAEHKEDLAARKGGQRLAAAALAILEKSGDLMDNPTDGWVDEVLVERPYLALAMHLHQRGSLSLKQWLDKKECMDDLRAQVAADLEAILERAAKPEWKVKDAEVKALLEILCLPFEVSDPGPQPRQKPSAKTARKAKRPAAEPMDDQDDPTPNAAAEELELAEEV